MYCKGGERSISRKDSSCIYYHKLKNYMSWYIENGAIEAVADGFDLYAKCCQKFKRVFSQTLRDIEGMVKQCIVYNVEVLFC